MVSDGVHRVPRLDWSYVDLPAIHTPALVTAEYEVVSEQPRVRLAILPQSDLERFRRDRSIPLLAATGFRLQGELRRRIDASGAYALVIEPEPGARVDAAVKLRVDVSAIRAARELSSGRRLAVVAASVVFLSTVIAAVAPRYGKLLRNSRD